MTLQQPESCCSKFDSQCHFRIPGVAAVVMLVSPKPRLLDHSTSHFYIITFVWSKPATAKVLYMNVHISWCNLYDIIAIRDIWYMCVWQVSPWIMISTIWSTSAAAAATNFHRATCPKGFNNEALSTRGLCWYRPALGPPRLAVCPDCFQLCLLANLPDTVMPS